MVIVITKILFLIHIICDISGFFLWISFVDQINKGRWLVLPLIFSFLADMYFRISYFQQAESCYQYFLWSSIAILWMKVMLLNLGWEARQILLNIKSSKKRKFFIFYLVKTNDNLG